MSLIIIALFGGISAFLVYRQGMLTISGVLAAAVMGLLVLGLGGWVWGLILITFFLSSNALTRYQRAKKGRLAGEPYLASRRALSQTLAKGMVGTGTAVAYFFNSQEVLFAAFLGALATANADTWATELGMLSPHRPRLLTAGRPVPAGTSGAITVLGLAAAAAGALAIGGVAFLFLTIEHSGPEGSYWVPYISLLTGLSGALVDSLLGATVQACFYCPLCQKEFETRRHTHHGALKSTRGWRWLDNDGVNFVSTLWGALVGVLLYQGWYG
ncbi:MAG: DUF92 domain-containing protein [Chloroflexi bacterium]|nr:DUF92 domain-containing protein [Chloroflexota bacterium]